MGHPFFIANQTYAGSTLYESETLCQLQNWTIVHLICDEKKRVTLTTLPDPKKPPHPKTLAKLTKGTDGANDKKSPKIGRREVINIF